MQKVAPQIETGRLVLRAHQIDDFDAVAAMWSDPEVVRYIGGRASTREESWARLLRYAGNWAMLGFGFWTIRDRSTGVYLGEGGLLQGQRSIDPGFGAVPEVGWALISSARGRGYAHEAVAAMLGWADAQAIDRTACLIEPDNTPSIRLAQKLGFKEYARTTYHGARVNLYERKADA